jgi:uncharacterized radical SAM superfamily Fe-S cluster-containing enzyme
MKLIKRTRSICPEDLRILDAELWEIDGQVIIRKTCPDHGSFEDVYWSDYVEYVRANRFRDDGTGLVNSTESQLGCPHDCGICQEHRTHTSLLLIDVTNRCNLRCPICFARGGEGKNLNEPSMEQIRGILEYTQEINHPIRVRAVGNSGGEPTLRDDLPEIIRMEKEFGFEYILVMTNGLRIAEDIDYFKKLSDLNVYIYLQFDGVTPEPYLKARGRDLWPIKQKVIENARKVGCNKVVCVPTLAKGINDHHVGEMIRYVAENCDVIKHIVFQPISFSGRIDRTRLKEMRVTTSDVMRLCEEQTDGEIKKTDFFPLSMNQTLARIATKGSKHHDFCVHPHCGAITLINYEKNKLVPIPRFIRNEEYYDKMRRAFDLNKSTPQIIWALLTGFMRYIHPKLWLRVSPIFLTKSFTSIRSLTEDWLWTHWFTVAVMHYMDLYNFDLDRVQGCTLHYGVPDNETKARLIPFCTMNNIYRPKIEEQLAIHSKEKESLVPT